MLDVRSSAEYRRLVQSTGLDPVARKTGFWQLPQHQVELAEAPRTAAEYWRRVDALERAVAELGGRLVLHPAVENGWVPVVEMMTLAMVTAMCAEDYVTVRMKSKFGTLRVSVSFSPSCEQAAAGQYIADVAAWAEAATEGRCQLSGMPGWNGPLTPGPGGWLYTLSDEIRATFSASSIRRFVSPPRPESDGNG